MTLLLLRCFQAEKSTPSHTGKEMREKWKENEQANKQTNEQVNE